MAEQALAQRHLEDEVSRLRGPVASQSSADPFTSGTAPSRNIISKPELALPCDAPVLEALSGRDDTRGQPAKAVLPKTLVLDNTVPGESVSV